MKRKVLAILVPALLMAGAAMRLKFIIKTATKLTCMAKLMRVIPSLTTLVTTAMKPMYRWVSKAKLRLQMS